jgi:hypothetical protein
VGWEVATRMIRLSVLYQVNKGASVTLYALFCFSFQTTVCVECFSHPHLTDRKCRDRGRA